MDRVGLAEFLRSRRELLQPEEVGLPRGTRRRTPGLRRDEVAELSGVSTDYYTRIEQPSGPVPSEDVLNAIAAGLRLTADERAHLHRLAGRPTVDPEHSTDEISADVLRIFGLLEQSPAQIVTGDGVTLLQTEPAKELLGDETGYTGLMRSRVYRWFADPAARRGAPEEDHPAHSRTLVARIAQAAAAAGPHSRASAIVEELRFSSPEFAELWSEHPVVGAACEPKRLLHDDLGELELHGQTLLDPGNGHALMVFTGDPGSETERKLQQLVRGGAYRLPAVPSRVAVRRGGAPLDVGNGFAMTRKTSTAMTQPSVSAGQ